jgi:hypothetical protein
MRGEQAERSEGRGRRAGRWEFVRLWLGWWLIPGTAFLTFITLIAVVAVVLGGSDWSDVSELVMTVGPIVYGICAIVAVPIAASARAEETRQAEHAEWTARLDASYPTPEHELLAAATPADWRRIRGTVLEDALRWRRRLRRAAPFILIISPLAGLEIGGDALELSPWGALLVGNRFGGRHRDPEAGASGTSRPSCRIRSSSSPASASCSTRKAATSPSTR